MEWYYAEGGEQRGPVSEAEFSQLVVSGRIGPGTLVWRAGMTDWQPHGQVQSAASGPAAAAAPAAGGGVVCSQCGRAFAEEQVIRVADRLVCAECKPVVLQQLREGALPGRQSRGSVTQEEVLARDYETPIGEYFNTSWQFFKEHMGVLIGAAVLVYLAIFACNIIPYLSVILSLIFQGPLLAGLWVFYVRAVRGEELTVGQAFGGFGPRFWQLVLTNVVSGFLTMVPMIPFIVVMVVFAVSMGGVHQAEMSAPGVGMILAMVLTGLAGFFGAIYLAVSWFFALPLVLDKNLGFWEAMELSRRTVSKHFWSTLALSVVVWLLAMCGVLLCLVGLLFTAPVGFLMFVRHYERVFGDLTPAAD